MLKVYNIYDYVSIDGAKWRRVGGYRYMATDEEVEDKLILDNVSFDEARKYLSENSLNGIWNSSTFFRHRPMVEIHYFDNWSACEYRCFNTLSYKREVVENTNISFEWLTQHLTADQFIQYLKERGITACPMNF